MPEVAVRIGPKTYSVACAQGEEDRVRELAAVVAEKYAQLGTARAPLEAQNMLFAALFMADELAEGRGKVAAAAAARDAALAEAGAARAALERAKTEIEERLTEEYAASMQAIEAERAEAIETLRNEQAAALEAQAEELRAARAELAAARTELERERSTCDDLKTDLRAENDALRRAEARAREETDRLAGELAELRAAQVANGDLFAQGAEEADAAGLADTLEALAKQAEEAAQALEQASQPPPPSPA